MTEKNNRLIFILTVGVFGILSTEMGVIGILPSIAEQFQISVSQAGLLVSMFALAVAISAPIMPLLFSAVNRKKVMLLVLGIFIIGNIVSIFTSNFTVLLIARVIPAFFHPIYCSMALTVAATSVGPDQAPKAVSKVMLGITAGMILSLPIANFIASEFSIQMVMLFFAVINALAFIATIFFIPSMPVKERLSYGAQISILKSPVIWLSIATVIFIGSAVASVNSYVTEYLSTIADLSGGNLSVVLFLFGLASLVGTLVAGRLLTKNAMKTVMFFPVVSGAVLLVSLVTGSSSGPIIITILFWGFLFAIGNMISQYWLTSSAPEAPDFANGLFLCCGNLGITIGTTVGGLFISGMGTQYIVLGGVLFMVLSLPSILLRNYLVNPTKKQLTN